MRFLEPLDSWSQKAEGLPGTGGGEEVECLLVAGSTLGRRRVLEVDGAMVGQQGECA